MFQFLLHWDGKHTIIVLTCTINKTTCLDMSTESTSLLMQSLAINVGHSTIQHSHTWLNLSGSTACVHILQCYDFVSSYNQGWRVIPGTFLSDFPRSPFSMLILTVLARLLSATLKQRVVRVRNSIFETRVLDNNFISWSNPKLNSSAVN